MASESIAQYGSLPSTTTTSGVAAAIPFHSRARSSNTQPLFATRRPWNEFLELSSFTRPLSLTEATGRIKRNLSYFRMNYAMITLFVLFVSLIWHPISMIVFLAVFILWFFLYFFRDEPLLIFGRRIDDRFVMATLGVLTVVALVLTDVWLNVLVSVLVGGFVVSVHAAFRGIESLYCDDLEVDDGGLLSVVGSPTKSRYTGI